MSSDRGAPPRLSEAELPAVTPLEFIVTRDNGRPGLDVREGEFEQVYSVDDMYSRLLFIALCRQEGATVYRRPRQRVVTICVRTTLSKHNSLWQRFLSLSAMLDGQLAEVARQFLVERCEASER
ncbi:MAG: hypothetical protein WDO69_00495 [Pseudomonadota bacterium]